MASSPIRPPEGEPVAFAAEPRVLRTKAEEALAAEYASARDMLPGGAVARARRDAAFAQFARSGLPHRRVEAWKYTDLRALMRIAQPLAEEAASEALGPLIEADPLRELDRARIVVANGAFRPELSDLAGAGGVTVESLAEVLDKTPERIGRLFADADDAMLALNTALMRGGVIVRVEKNAAPVRPIEIVHLTVGPPASVFVRNVVEIGANASVRIVESHRGPADSAYQANVVTELDVGEGAKVPWTRLQAEGDAATHVTSFVVRLARDATLNHLSVNAGSSLWRWQGLINIAGTGAEVAFNGATMLSRKEHGDSTLVVTHSEPHGRSRELFKNVVDGEASGAFQGKIIVDPGAQKTDAKMMTQALLLSDYGQFASKPELEIFADDVQCGHGATSGQIDETSLFYLMARGIPRAEAERLLIEAFLDEAIDVVGDEAIASSLKGTVAAWLARRGGRS